MDRQLIEQKLEALRHAVERVREKCPTEPAALAEDEDRQDIVVLNLTRAVQICVDIASHIIASSSQAAPTTMAQAFDSLAAMAIVDDQLAYRMRRAVGFRNIAVHNYERVDWAIVHRLASRQLQDFEDFATAVAKSSKTRPRVETTLSAAEAIRKERDSR